MGLNDLNFKVLLDDSDFRKTVAQDKALAKSLNTSLSNVLNVKMKSNSAFSQIKQLLIDIKTNTGAVADKIYDIEGGINRTADAANKTAGSVEEIKGAMDNVGKSTQSANSQMQTQSGIMREIAGIAGAYLSVRGAQRFVSSLVDITGQFETQKVALTSMIGDAGKAEEIFSELRQSALESPYTFQDLTKYAKQLIAFDIDADHLVETEKMLADVAAGLGVDVGRIILAYGQVKAAGVLKGTEMRQFSEAGVPLLKSLADQIEATEGKMVSLGEVYSRISKKEIPFEMVEKAFRDMTSEGGKFYNMQEVLVNTLQGKIGKLRDVWQQSLYDIGSSNSTFLKGAVDIAIKLAGSLGTIVDILGPLVAGMGAYAAISAVVWGLDKLKIVGEFVKYILNLASGLNAATAAQTAFTSSQKLANGALATASGSFAAIAGVLTALAVAFVTVNNAISDNSSKMDAANSAIAEYNGYLRAEYAIVDDLFKKMEELATGTEEYNNAKNSILSRYGQYLSNVDREQLAVGELAGVYDRLKQSIADAANERIKTQALGDLDAEFAKDTADIIKGAADAAYGVLANIATNAIPVSKSDLRDVIIDYVTTGDLPDSDTYAGQAFYAIKGSRNLANLGIVKYTPLETYRELYAEAQEEYESNKIAIERAFENLKKANGGVGLNGDGARVSLSSVVKNINEYSKLLREYKNSFKNGGLSDDEIKDMEAVQQLLEKQKQLYKTITGKEFGGSGGGDRDQIRELEKTINTVKQFRDAYNTLIRGGATDAEARGVLGTLFPAHGDMVNIKDYDDELARLMNLLKSADKESYKAMMLADGMKAFNEQTKNAGNAETALERYNKALAKWVDTAKEYEGVGVRFSVSKILSDADNKKSKIDTQLIEDIDKAREAYKGNNEELEKQVTLLNAYATAAKKAVDVETQDKLNKLAEKIVKATYTEKGINLQSLGSASQAYLSDLKEKLQVLIDAGEGILGDDLLNSIKESGLAADDLLGIIKQILSTDLAKVADRNFTKLQKKLTTFSAAMEKLGAKTKEMGDVLGKDWVVGLGSVVNEAGELSKILTGSQDALKLLANPPKKLDETSGEMVTDWRAIVKSADMWTLALNFGMFFLDKILDHERAIAEQKQRQAKAARLYKQYMDDVARGAAKTLFGTDDLELLRTNLEILKYYESYLEKQKSFLSFIDWGYGYVNEDGSLNLEKIKAALESGTLEAEGIQGAIDGYEKSLEAVKSTMDSIFGDVADKMTDKIIDGWIEAGDAALDYADIMDDVARSYAHMVLKSAILEMLPETDTFAQMFLSGDSEGALQQLSEALNTISQADWSSLLSAFDPYFKKDGEAAEESSNLSSGIKSITEDTANLLAAYINAIRADVAAGNVQRGEILSILKEYVGLGSAPSYTEYLVQIEAHTANLASNTNSILSELRSIITPESGLPAVRVQTA